MSEQSGSYALGEQKGSTLARKLAAVMGEVARVKKTWEGLARTMFTTADNYVVRIHRPLEEPLRSMVVASALSVDTALKQDQRGLN